MYLCTTRAEMRERGWQQLDVVLVTGDSYIDSSYMGVVVIGKVLERAGYRVGIIGLPDLDDPQDIGRLGEPRLFWGVSGGSVDSMVSNYTSLRRRRHKDDYTPGGVNDRRPDRAVIAYCNLIRRHFKRTRPIVIGGIEASLRRVAHYDFWSDRVRRSILFDAKADYLVYGMGESAVLELARCLDDALERSRPAGDDEQAAVRAIKGLCYVAKEAPAEHLALPSYETVFTDKRAFIEMFHAFYRNCDPLTARGLTQRHGDRVLVQNPPQPYLTADELDRVHELEFENAQHPHYEAQGKVKALETIRFSLNTHRGCYGECNFCAIGVHQGQAIRSRNAGSVVREAQRMTEHPEFKGRIFDVGGPTANMYGFDCVKRVKKGDCQDKRCLTPTLCKALRPDHAPQTELLAKLRALPEVEHVHVASGIRPDIVVADHEHGERYLSDVVQHHVSGQLKLAPEHTDTRALELMGKPPIDSTLEFRERFYACTEAAGKPQHLTYYFIAAHPGDSERDAARNKRVIGETLEVNPRQVQVFTPLPSTYSALMYHTGIDPFTGRELFVEKDLAAKRRQKDVLVSSQRDSARPAAARRERRRRRRR